jgi:NhaC family Na+:H+ antiporter
VARAGFFGYSAKTGVKLVDGLLSRGGAVSIQDTITLIICACLMGGALHKSGVLTVFVEKGLFKLIKKPAQLVVGTMVYCYAVLLLSGNQILGIILGGRTFKDAYAEMNVHAKVLSRTLEDTNTIGAPLVPWSTAALFITSVLGVTVAYIPYALLGFIVPIFSILCAYSKIGMWDINEAPLWGRKKGIPPKK